MPESSNWLLLTSLVACVVATGAIGVSVCGCTLFNLMNFGVCCGNTFAVSMVVTLGGLFNVIEVGV